MKTIETAVGALADALWGNWLLFVLLGLGIWCTVLTGFVQIRRLPFLLRSLASSRKQDAGEGRLSSPQALLTAISSCVGSGNIVGVSTAILSGGPGALFWMWVAAFFGMATKFCEIVLGMCYQGKDRDGNVIGGPMYYISHALHTPAAGVLVALLLFVQNAGGTLIQSNTISSVVNQSFGLAPLFTGIFLALVMTFIISGGLRRLVKVAQFVAPFMALLYVAGGLIVILANAPRIPWMFGQILGGAFHPQAALGAAAGLTVRDAMRYGVARGLYSNEAGEGSAAVLHAGADVDHPVRQGIYGIAEVFVDTIVICSTTGFAVVITGATSLDSNAATLAASAFGTVLPLFSRVVPVCLVLFAGTSLMSQWYFGHVSLNYLGKPRAAFVYRLLFPLMILLGSLSTVDLVWSIQDCALGLLIIPNVIALLLLSPQVRRLTREFFDPNNPFIHKQETRTAGSKGEDL